MTHPLSFLCESGFAVTALAAEVSLIEVVLNLIKELGHFGRPKLKQIRKQFRGPNGYLYDSFPSLTF